MKKIRKKPVKLIELIRTLDRKEFNGFGRYVKSMVKDENVHKLFLELKKYAPKFELSQKDREKVFVKIFGKEEYNNRQLNYLTSAVNLHLEEYLIMIAIRQDAKQKDYMLMEYYKSRNQYDFFKRTAASIMEKEEEKKVKDAEYYLTKMKIEYDLYHYVETDNKRVERQAIRIEQMVNSLDEFYMYYKLNLASDLTTFGKSFNVEKNISLFLKEIQEIIQEHPIHKNTLIQIYLFIINNFQNHTYENYLLLRAKTLKVIDNISHEHQRALFACLSNYAVVCNRKGLPNFRKYIFEILQLGIDREYMVQNGELSYQSFINSILMATGLEINEIEWAKKTIKNKGYLINDKVREDCLLLANAYIDYATMNYGGALQKLNRIEHWRQYSFGMQGRLLTLKCYYELDIETDGQYLDTAEYFADAYRNYLRRNKIFSNPLNKRIINLITFTIKIMRNRYSKKYNKEELYEEIKKYEPIAAKRWAFEIINTHLQRKKKTA